MTNELTMIKNALHHVSSSRPGLSPHMGLIEASLVQLKEYYPDLLRGDPDAFLTLAVGEVSRDLIFCLERAIKNMDEGGQGTCKTTKTDVECTGHQHYISTKHY